MQSSAGKGIVFRAALSSSCSVFSNKPTLKASQNHQTVKTGQSKIAIRQKIMTKHPRILALPTQLKNLHGEKIRFSKFGLTKTRRYHKFVDRDKAKIGQTIVYFLFNELFVIEFLSCNLFRYNKNDISVYFEKKRLISRFRAFIFMK